MAITLNDLKERLEAIDLDLVNLDYGHARMRLINIIGILERSGITIHAIATTESKKVETDDDKEE